MRLDEFLQTSTITQTFEKGEIIFKEGAQANAAYYMIDGKVEIFAGTINKDPSILAVLGPGEIFGEMALLRFDKYTLSARAVETTRLHVITPELMQEQVRTAHPLLKAILGMVIERIHDTNEVLIQQEQVSRM